MAPFTSTALVALGASIAYLGPLLSDHLGLRQKLEELNFFPASEPVTPPPSTQCSPHTYTTELISLDPLLVYIHNFIPPHERASIIAEGSIALTVSTISGSGSDTPNQHRTSRSAPLPLNHTATNCVLERSAAFMGTLMAPGRDDMGMAQMVHYTASQKFDLHHDWFQRPRVLREDGEVGRKRMYNRAATFFAVLDANCTGGETWFPQAKVIQSQERAEEERERVWEVHPDGGLKFRPVPGNALFWINLKEDGSGDVRTLHAGLPVGEGTKTAMNIWPRQFFGPDA